VVLCYGKALSLAFVIFMDLTRGTCGREIHSEAERYGDMQFLSDEINAFD